MKRAGFHKWFGNGKFPAIAAQRSCVEQNRDEIKFFIRRIAREQQSGTHLGRQPEIHLPDFTAADGAHLPPPFGRASSRLPKRPGHKAQSPHFPPPIRTTCDAPTAVRPRSTSATRSKFQSRSCEESTVNGRCWQVLRIALGEHGAGNQNLVADLQRADFFFDKRKTQFRHGSLLESLFDPPPPLVGER